MRLLVLALVLAAFLAGGCASGDNRSEQPRTAASSQPAAAATGGKQITISMFRFSPDTVEIDHGTTLEWVNKDEILHTVTAGKLGEPSGQFDSELPTLDATFSFRFDQHGTYTFFCNRHTFMKGQIVVR